MPERRLERVREHQLAEALQPSGASRRRRPAAFRRRAPIFFSLSESRVAGGYPPLVRPEVQGNSDRHTRRHVRSAARVSTVCKPFAAAAHISSDEVFSRVVRRTARSFLTTVVPWREERRTLTWDRTNSEL